MKHHITDIIPHFLDTLDDGKYYGDEESVVELINYVLTMYDTNALIITHRDDDSKT